MVGFWFLLNTTKKNKKLPSCAPPRGAHPDTATGARTVPVRSGFTHEGRLQTVEANPLFVRAADGDGPRSGGSVRIRPRASTPPGPSSFLRPWYLRAPFSLTPSLSPSGGEGARRAGEGVVQGFKARNWFRRILSPGERAGVRGEEGPRLSGRPEVETRLHCPGRRFLGCNFGIGEFRESVESSTRWPLSNVNAEMRKVDLMKTSAAMTRRNFVKTSAAGLAATAARPWALAGADAARPEKMIGDRQS